MGSVPLILPRVDIEGLSPLPQTSPFQHGGNTDDDFCQQHVDIDVETREDDQDRATQDASPDCTDETKIQTEKMTANKKEEGTEETEKKMKKERRKKKQMKARSKTQSKIKIATCLSRKMPMKKSTPLKMKKTGSITLIGAQKKPRNTWKNTK